MVRRQLGWRTVPFPWVHGVVDGTAAAAQAQPSGQSCGAGAKNRCRSYHPCTRTRAAHRCRAGSANIDDVARHLEYRRFRVDAPDGEYASNITIGRKTPRPPIGRPRAPKAPPLIVCPCPCAGNQRHERYSAQSDGSVKICQILLAQSTICSDDDAMSPPPAPNLRALRRVASA